jgi:prepilin-type N-terminal cleavage/methylation domain-containing protein
MNTQKGFTLTEIMVAIGVVSALMVNGYNFYSNAIAKAQANESMTTSKLISDNLHEYYARFHQLPDSHVIAGPVGADGDTYTEAGGANDGPFAGPYLPEHGTSNGYVNFAMWHMTGANEGFVEVLFKLSDVQAQISGKAVQFWFQVTPNLSHIDYLGCRTNIVGGNYDGVDVAAGITDIRSPILQECLVGLASDVSTAALGADGNIED